MKTAMQELIDVLIDVAKRNSGSKAVLGVNDAINEASKLLNKEREQIINAHSIGNRKGLDNQPLGAAKYFRETYEE